MPSIITVTGLTDGDGVFTGGANPSDTTLRGAIANAASGDTIQFQSGLLGSLDLSTSEGGLGTLVIDSNLRIQGPSNNAITIEGGNTAGATTNAQDFSIEAGSVTLSNLVISNGYSIGNGGGIDNFGGTLTVTNSTVTNNSAVSGTGGGIYNYDGTLSVTNSTLTNNSAVVGDGGGNGGALYNNGTATLTNCTVSGNTASQDGGGLDNSGGTATLTYCTLSSNSATTGGGLYNTGTYYSGDEGRDVLAGMITLTNCTVSGNTATNGGGLSNHGYVIPSSDLSIPGTAYLTNCTVSGNTVSQNGGGLDNYGGTATLTNCTLSGNSAATGGGICNSGTANSGNGEIYQQPGTVMLSNCTVSGNSATSGGGLYNNGGQYTYGIVNIGNTIVAANTASPEGPDALGAFASQGNNLIGETDGSSGWLGSDLTGTIATPLDPLLSALGDYGGPTQTMALLPGSPAIDAGSDALIPGGATTDQRGLPRIVNGTVDIGAFESSGFTIAVQSGGNQSTINGTAFANPLQVSVTANNPIEPVAGGVVSYTVNPATGGASATLSSDSATIAADGTASVTATANSVLGSYTVSASTVGSTTPATFNLTNDETPSLVVTTTEDVVNPTDGLTCLREAINYAESLGGNPTITFASGLAGTINLSTLEDGLGTLVIDSNLTIQGPSDNSITIEGGSTPGATTNAQVFQITSGTVSLENLVISNGSTTGNGGGIANSGNLTLTNCTVSGNSAPGAGEDGGDGGGLYNTGSATLTLTNCTVSGNSSTYFGGGLFNLGTATLSNCTVSGNSSQYGGGLANFGTATAINCTVSGNSATLEGGGLANFGSATLTNCTVSGNSASGAGGGLCNYGTTTLTNCTVSGNSAQYGGGLYDTRRDDGNTPISTVGNTIVAGNTATLSGPDASGTVASLGNNLIGKTDGSTGWTASDLTGTIAAPLVALLAPLGFYGGPTQTMPPLPGSPAIDAGDNALIPDGVTTDQRGAGYPRIVNGTVDIGAVETGGPTLTTTASPALTLGTLVPTISDLAVLTGGYLPDGFSSSITFTLKLGTTTVYTETDQVSGDGTYLATYPLPTTGPVTGTYTWSAFYSGDAENNSASDQGGAAEQTGVSAASPTLSTTPTQTDITYDGSPTTLMDTADLEAGYYPTGTITFTLYDENGHLVDTETAIVSGNGTYSTPTGYTLPSPAPVVGTYQWDAIYNGDGNNNSIHDNGNPAEQVTVFPATPTVSITDAGGTYTSHPFQVTAATVTGVGSDGTVASLTLDSSTLSFTYYTSGSDESLTPVGSAPTAVGSYAVIGTYTSDNANYTNAASNVVFFSITQATPTVSVADAGGTYTSDPFPVTAATVTGVGNNGAMASLSQDSSTLSLTYYTVNQDKTQTPIGSAPTAAGSYAVIASYTSDNGNYTNAASTVVFFSITPATPAVSVFDPGGTYTSDPFPVTMASVIGVGRDGILANLSMQSATLSFTYYTVGSNDGLTPLGSTAPSALGSYAVIATYTSDNGNYMNATSAVVGFSITPATPIAANSPSIPPVAAHPEVVVVNTVTPPLGAPVASSYVLNPVEVATVVVVNDTSVNPGPDTSIVPTPGGRTVVNVSTASMIFGAVSGPEFAPSVGVSALALSSQGSLFPQPESPLPLSATGGKHHPLPPVLPLDQTLSIGGFSDSGGDSFALVDQLYRAAGVDPRTTVLLIPPVSQPAAGPNPPANDLPTLTATAGAAGPEDTPVAAPSANNTWWWFVGALVAGVAVATQIGPARRWARWVARTFSRLPSPQSPSQGQL